MNQNAPQGWQNPPTSEFGPVNPQGYGPPPRKQGMSTALVVVLTVAVVVLIGLLIAAAFLVVPRLMGAGAGPTTSTVSVTATAPAGAGESSSDGNVPTVQPAKPAPAGRPSGAYECWSGGNGQYLSTAVGSSVTSCEFAESVWSAYLGAGANGGSATVVAYSPVTGTSYTMSCAGGPVVTCTGGNNAVVYIY